MDPAVDRRSVDPYDLAEAVLTPADDIDRLQPSSRWALDGDLHPPYRPPHLINGYAPRDTNGAASIALPERWFLEQPRNEGVGISLLADARLFPGRIRRRSPRHHAWGQLILTSDFERVPASLSIIGGHGTLPEAVDLTVEPTRMTGTHCFLGSLHPHFGHFLVEGLSRIWAYRRIVERHADAKLLVYEPGVPRFILRLLAMAGIEADRLVSLSAPTQVERLYVPDVSMRTHRWVTRLQRSVWDEIATSAAPDGATAGENVYLSRRGVSNRALANEPAIEAAFARRGFRIVRPESLDIVEQVRLATQARTLAGCVGSQMYLAAFQRPGARNLVIAPSNFLLRDDSLIADVMEHELSIAFGSVVDFRTEVRSWTVEPDVVEAALEHLGSAR